MKEGERVGKHAQNPEAEKEGISTGLGKRIIKFILAQNILTLYVIFSEYVFSV